MLNLFFPILCNGCNAVLLKNETIICSLCRHNLPLTNFYLHRENLMKQRFYGRVEICNAVALFYYQKKNFTQSILHNLKYRGQQDIGTFFGKWLGALLLETTAYNDLDYVIPVPLHKKKLRQRGYNQVTKFAQEISNSLNKPYIANVLLKKTATKTQVFKKRLNRLALFNTNKEVFSISNSTLIKHKHVLLVDDIITTGTTLELCATKLLESGCNKVSVATLAIA